MSGGTAKIRLKIGQLEVEYEGQSSFLRDDLFDLMKKVVGFYAEHKGVVPAEPPPAQTGWETPGAGLSGLDYSTNTIAAHLNANSGPELAIAAAAHLVHVKKKDTFTRQEINAEMKGATTYYKANMSTNLTKSLNTLVKNKRLNQVSKGVYALSATEKKSLEAKLAQPL